FKAQRRSCEANRTVGGTGLALKFGGRSGGPPALELVLLVGVDDVVVVDAGRVDPGDTGNDLGELLVVVEDQRRREVGELKGAENQPLAARLIDPSGDYRPASPAGRAQASLGSGRERHPVAAAKEHLPQRAAQRGVAPG